MTKSLKFIAFLGLCSFMACKSTKMNKKPVRMNMERLADAQVDQSNDGMIFSREVTYVNRSLYEEIMTEVESGKEEVFSIITCINKAGEVSYVEIDEANTTSSNKSTLKKILDMVKGYKYEADNKAVEQQCGLVKIMINKSL